MPAPAKVTPEEVERIRALDRDGHTYSAIGRMVQRSKTTVRHILDPVAAAREQARNASRKRDNRARCHRSRGRPKTYGTAEGQRAHPILLKERDLRRARPFSIAYDILGEPEPGRSALDRMTEAHHARQGLEPGRP